MRLRGRMTLHFFLQFIIFFIVSFLTIFSLLTLVFIFFISEESDANPRRALIENIPILIDIYEDRSVQVNDELIEQLQENDMWMQLLDQEGNVLYSANIPKSISKEKYSLHEMALLEETKQLNNYEIETYYDEWGHDTYYYIFGFDSTNQTMLDNWFQQYSNNGKVDPNKTDEFEKLLDKQHGVLEIYKDDELIQTIGSSLKVEHEKSDLLSFIYTPGKRKTKATIYNDANTNTTWIFHQHNEQYTEPKESISLQRELKVLLLATLVSISVAIAFSIWNAYRYGKPLFLILDWLDGIENKQYDEIFSDKVREKIYKRNGKVKRRYRLYQEVIHSFTEMTKKLSLAEKEREQLEKTRMEWMSGISHDLRTPIASIQGYGHLLESSKYDFSKDELQEIGTVIREKSDYMVKLVDDFSLIFKLKNSAISFHKTTVELNEFISHIVEKFTKDLTMKDYSFVFYPSIKTYVFIDPKWFERVLDNLLINAVKHNPPHTLIEVKVKRQGETAIIEITDDGVGMEKELLDKLFNRYYRGTNTKERAEGDGLGMSIAKAIVDLHDGDIRVTSKKNKGTTITMILKTHTDEVFNDIDHN